MAPIDTHCHFLPPDVVEYLRGGTHPYVRIEDEDGQVWIEYEAAARFPLSDGFHDVRTQLDRMDRDGIEISLVSIAPPLFLYELDVDATDQMARLVNDAAARLAAESDGRLRGIATVPLNDPDRAATELLRARQDLGLSGVEIGTSVGETMLDAPELEPFFATAAELGIPVLLHPYRSMLGEAQPSGTSSFFMQNSVANPLETHVAAARLILGGVLDRHPGLVVQLPHGGGSFPYQLGRLDQTYDLRPDVRRLACKRPSEYLSNFLFDTVLYNDRQLAFLIDLVGPERVVFGSDYPFNMVDLTGLGFAARLDEDAARQVTEANARSAYAL